MKTRFWSSDWFAGLLISLVVIVFSASAPFQSLERSFYDWGVRSTDRLPSDKVAVIAIDDDLATFLHGAMNVIDAALANGVRAVFSKAFDNCSADAAASAKNQGLFVVENRHRPSPC